MTIQINVSQKDLNHKLQVCKKLSHYYSLCMPFDFKKYIDKFNYLSEQINHNGNYEEIYQDLQQIERELLELM
jgi:hypothetical protein